MMKLKIFLTILIVVASCADAIAQRRPNRSRRGRSRVGMEQTYGLDYGIGQFLTSNDAFACSAEAWASVSSNSDLRPLLSYSNEWGRYTQYKQGEFAYLGSVAFAHRMVDHRFGFKACVTGEVSTDNKRIMFNEAYLNFDIWMAQVRIGLEQYTPIETNTDLSIGSYLMSNNAHAIPRVWLGVMDYWAPLSLLKTKGFNAGEAFDLRFGLSFGRMDDEGDESATDDVLIHEKFAYIRASQWFLKPYVGIYHSALIGGVTAYDENIPKDLGASIFGHKGSKSKFSEDFLREEVSTPAGANQGMWDFGIDFVSPIGDGKLYYQRPHADGQSRKPFGKEAKDFTIGLQVDFDNLSFPQIQSLTLEFMSQKWQGGDNMNIPCVPDQDGGYSYVFLDQISNSDIDRLKSETLNRSDVSVWEAENGLIDSKSALKKFLSDTYNGGKDFGGRYQYLDNHLYRQGWTRRGLSTGNPLMHTRRTVKAYAPDGSMSLLAAFPNTRVVAFNVGLKGNILPDRLDYLWRTTITKNYGNYNEQYVASDSSSMSSSFKSGNYFYDQSRLEVYTKIDATYTFSDELKFKGNISFDAGDLYSSFAFRLGVGYYFNQDNISRVTRSNPSKRNDWRKPKRKSNSNKQQGLSTFKRGR